METTAVKVATGAAMGVGTGLANAAAPHAKTIGMGAANASASFFNGATKALKNHKGVAGAISAGTAAVVGHGAAATLVVAAAPVVVAGAAIAAVGFGIFKLVEKLNE
jgi:hypothetical protein